MSPSFAYLAEGKVRLKQGDEPPRTLECQFGQTIRERAVKAGQRHDWKTGGAGEKFLSGAMLWGHVPKDPAAIRISLTSLCQGAADGQLLYSLETDDVCAVLSSEGLGTEERRLWHNNQRRLSHLAVASDGALACSIRHKLGTANLAVRLDDESGFAEVTEGDSVDTAPRWVPGDRRRLVYQSAGVARDREGIFCGIGPFGIQLIDIDQGELTSLLEEPDHDLLTPQMTADGNLYFIRRPHRSGRDVRFLQVAKDVLMFPFAVAVAIYHYLQFFSIKYTGRTLSSSSGSQSKPMDLKQMMIWGNTVASQRESKKGEEAPDLVPKTWQLVKRSACGREDVLTRGALAFDLMPDGTVLFSNGSAVFQLQSDGSRKRIVMDSMIEQVVALHPRDGAPPTQGTRGE